MPDVRLEQCQPISTATAATSIGIGFYASLGYDICSGHGAYQFYLSFLSAIDESDRWPWTNSAQTGSKFGCVDLPDLGERSREDPSAVNRTLRKTRWPDPRHANYPYTSIAASMTDVVFATVSNADLGFAEIYLTQRQADHISIGHRDVGSLVYTIVKQAIEQTTQIYLSAVPRRLVYLSSNVTTRSGHPMTVVIERVESKGKVITATWKDKVRGMIIWDSTNGLYANFDDESDVLYISRGPSVISYASEDPHDPDIWYRYSDDDNSHTGVTIFRAKELKSREMLAKIASYFLGVAETQIADRLANVMGPD
jgi:hypothetical protein